MTDLAEAVPESAITQAFSGVLAISPETLKQRLEMLAAEHGVPCDDAFREYVMGVLRKQSPADWD